MSAFLYPATIASPHPAQATSRRLRNLLPIVMAALLATPAAGLAKSQADADKVDRAAARRAAVALNYCRGSFYRIRQNPSQEVLTQERRKILNNLNLTAIQDRKIVELYTSTLDEISNIGIARQERDVVKQSYGKSWKSLATVTAFGFLTDASSFDYAAMIRRGASSWWDFRGIQVNRNMNLWDVQKKRLTTIQAKSSSFLQASWELAHSHKIPDTWLVRNADFQRLHETLRETNLKVRLRRLDRLAPFMECYPPYWYYLGRTQQQLGQFSDAEVTYLHAAELGDGHFRRDELLAAAMVNVASIRQYLDKPGASEAARRALAYTIESPQVNLAAAAVLMRNRQLADAENAILRNLDTGIETAQSEVALLAVYARQGAAEKILARLEDPALVNRTPIPILLRCAASLDGKTLPVTVARRLQSSFRAYSRNDQIVLVADPAWNLRAARFAVDESADNPPQLHQTAGAVTVSFPRNDGDLAKRGDRDEDLAVKIKYAEDFVVEIALQPAPARAPADERSFAWKQLLSFDSDQNAPPRQPSLVIASIETAGTLIALNNGRVQHVPSPSEKAPERALANVAPAEVPQWNGVQAQPAAYKPLGQSPTIPVSIKPASKQDSSTKEPAAAINGVTLHDPKPLLPISVP